MKLCFRRSISFTVGIFKAFHRRRLHCLQVRESIPPCNVHFMTMGFSAALSALMNAREHGSGQERRSAPSP